MRFRLLIPFLLCLLSPLQVSAEELPVVMKGDTIEYFDTQGKIVAIGHVTATHSDVKLTCDQATLYMETQDVYLTGRVRLVQPGGLLKGEEIIYNFKTKKGTILQAEGQADPWRTVSHRAKKVSGTSYLHKQGYLTSCDFEEPHTRFSARTVQVFLDDRIVLKNIVMKIGGVPIFYMPSYTHPLNDKRPRVTIIPGKDKAWGLFLLTAWRVYLNENLQGRFHIDYREKLDLATGIDLKYKLPVGGEGIFREYYTHERLLQRDHFYSKYFDEDDDRPTTERERYRFQLRHRWQMLPNTQATLEYHRTKDSTFIKDFFEREFEEGGPNPRTYFQIIRSTPWYGLTFFSSWRASRHASEAQEFPRIALDVRPLAVRWLPTLQDFRGRFLSKSKEQLKISNADSWYYKSSFKYIRSNTKDAVEGSKNSLHTYDTSQELFYPMRFFKWINFRPTVFVSCCGEPGIVNPAHRMGPPPASKRPPSPYHCRHREPYVLNRLNRLR